MSTEQWEIVDHRLKFGKWTLADLRFVAATPERARLIAAAPEMLEALENLVSAINRGIPLYPMHSSVNQIMPQYANTSMTTQQAEAAIRKARGKQ